VSIKSIVDRFQRAPSVHFSGSRDPIDVLAAEIDHLEKRVGAALRHRSFEIASALAPTTTEPDNTVVALRLLIGALTPLDDAKSWLLLAAIHGRLPDGAQVKATARTAKLDGTAAAVVATVTSWIQDFDGANGSLEVRIVSGRRLVDVDHTSRTDFATGIQRVTREVTRRWVGTHRPTLIGWRDNLSGMRELTPGESERACWGGAPVIIPDDDPTIIPWKCTYVLPELAAEVVRSAHLQTMAQYSGTSLNVIGYDLVPITTAETTDLGMSPGFARNLAAVRYARVIAPISVGAAGEYLGWRSMLGSIGVEGPRIEAVVLPTEAPPEDPVSTSAARARLTVGVLPLVLVVGSHEPRKNHLAVLHAAELLWREGLLFSLSFIGGNSWNSESFTETLAAMQDAGRPVEAISAATDDLLWGGYRTARFTVFPSLNEGFGLPVAESLACGTPVITSNFGSMKEIADAGGGALLVNPRDDHSIANGIRSLLTNDKLHATLVQQARTRPVRTWDTYAAETWQLLTGE